MDTQTLEEQKTQLKGLLADKRFEEAKTKVVTFLKNDPENPDLINYDGMIESGLGNIDAALDCFKKIVTECPDQPEGWYNYAFMLSMKESYDEAEHAIDKALELNPHNVKFHFCRAFYLLGRKDYEQGWREYEYRLLDPKRTEKLGKNFISLFNLPLEKASRFFWNGQDLKGKTVLALWDQGFGDTLMFARFIPELQKRGAKIAFLPQVELASLYAGVFEDVMILNEDNTKHGLEMDINHFCLVGSLPLHLKWGEAELPLKEGYLKNDYPLNEALTNIISSEKISVGLCWRGSGSHVNDLNRSMTLEDLEPLLEMEAVQYYSIQAGGDGEEAVAHEKVIHLGGEIKSFADTAAIMQNLDLVICVDTSVVHLAGTLGKEAWVMLPVNPDWRWGWEGERCDWYDSVRMFRQKELRNWKQVVGQIKTALVEKFAL